MSDDERDDGPEPTPVTIGSESDEPWRDRELFQWAMSASLGGVSEIAVLAPIRKGSPPGERRTYEQVARDAIGNLAARHAQGLPTELGKLSTIHFGRMIVLRPEQYLSYSTRAGVYYYEEPGFIGPDRAEDAHGPSRQVPKPIDDFREFSDTLKNPERTDYRSWILTLVEFDGDLKVYMRDIARSLNGDFDAIFKTCEAYPGADRYEDWWSWIRRFQVNVDLFYATYPNLSVVRIKQLETFKRRFDAFVARVRSPTGPRVRSMDELFDQFLAENQQFASGFPSPGGLFPTADDRTGG
jgi:hypothetical protein